MFKDMHASILQDLKDVNSGGASMHNMEKSSMVES